MNAGDLDVMYTFSSDFEGIPEKEKKKDSESEQREANRMNLTAFDSKTKTKNHVICKQDQTNAGI